MKYIPLETMEPVLSDTLDVIRAQYLRDPSLPAIWPRQFVIYVGHLIDMALSLSCFTGYPDVWKDEFIYQSLIKVHRKCRYYDRSKSKSRKGMPAALFISSIIKQEMGTTIGKLTEKYRRQRIIDNLYNLDADGMISSYAMDDFVHDCDSNAGHKVKRIMPGAYDNQ